MHHIQLGAENRVSICIYGTLLGTMMIHLWFFGVPFLHTHISHPQEVKGRDLHCHLRIFGHEHRATVYSSCISVPTTVHKALILHATDRSVGFPLSSMWPTVCFRHVPLPRNTTRSWCPDGFQRCERISHVWTTRPPSVLFNPPKNANDACCAASSSYHNEDSKPYKSI